MKALLETQTMAQKGTDSIETITRTQVRAVVQKIAD